MKNFYKKVGKCSAAKGNVLNIGLGEGASLDWLLSNSDVKKVTSVEINQAVIDSYKQKHGSTSKSVIKKGDAESVSLTGKFDLIYIDIEEDITPAVFIKLKAVALRCRNLLSNTGKLVIEYQCDVPLEQEFRGWILNHFHDGGQEFVRGESRADSGYIQYYIK